MWFVSRGKVAASSLRPALLKRHMDTHGHTRHSCQGHYRETDNMATFQVCMLWGAISGDILALVGQHKFEELQGMFLRGSLDRDLTGQVKLRSETFS